MRQNFAPSLSLACEARGAVWARGAVARGPIRVAASFPRGTTFEKLTASGCESCSVVVWMFSSSISAFKRTKFYLPTRPDGRAVGPSRFHDEFWMHFLTFLDDL